MQSGNKYCFHIDDFMYNITEENGMSQLKLSMIQVYEKLLKLKSNNKIQVKNQLLSRVHGYNRNWNKWKTLI
jgi:hypothetical protein